MKCVSNKIMYASQALAEDALIESHVRNDYAAGMGPVNVYQCDDCGNWHLTSKGSVNERLVSVMNEKSFKIQKEAGKWEQKFKKR